MDVKMRMMDKKDNASLDYIYNQQKELSVFGGIGALLGWDQMTYMPKNGASDRSEHGALISKLSHERVVSDEFWNHIQNLSSNIDDLEEKDKHVVKRLEKDVGKSRKIPSDYVTRMVKTTTVSYQKWEESREKNDFSVFSPHLKKIVELEKEYCGYIDIPGPRYNSLLDGYEEGMTVDKLNKEFHFLKKNLIEILENIKNSSTYQNQINPKIRFPINIQKELTQGIIEKMSLSGDRSRIDVSTHPFTTSLGYDDVRITTSYKEDSPLFSFFSTIHEAGHALYELGMPQDEYKNTVISDSPSLGMHESQSRFWENMVARSTHFWKYYYPLFQQKMPDYFKNTSFDEWYAIVNRVQPSLIRVEADELTYCLHVILRFEIETDLMEDRISVDELPQIWNTKMEEMLGVTPTNDKEGVLQDMHWSGGSIGYFPTYAIGSIYSAQLFNQLTKDNPDTLNQISQGDFSSIIQWLDKNIHKIGCRLPADDIVKQCCGEGLNSNVYISYLKDKYYQLYDV